MSDLAELPDRSIDWCFSNSVLEPIDDLAGALAQLRRLTTDDGQMVHTVDWADHDGCSDGEVTRMVYSDVPTKDTNGLRPSQLENLFRQAGFAGGKLNYLRFPAGLGSTQASRAPWLCLARPTVLTSHTVPMVPLGSSESLRPSIAMRWRRSRLG